MLSLTCCIYLPTNRVRDKSSDRSHVIFLPARSFIADNGDLLVITITNIISDNLSATPFDQCRSFTGVSCRRFRPDCFLPARSAASLGPSLCSPPLAVRLSPPRRAAPSCATDGDGHRPLSPPSPRRAVQLLTEHSEQGRGRADVPPRD